MWIVDEGFIFGGFGFVFDLVILYRVLGIDLMEFLVQFVFLIGVLFRVLNLNRILNGIIRQSIVLMDFGLLVFYLEYDGFQFIILLVND